MKNQIQPRGQRNLRVIMLRLWADPNSALGESGGSDRQLQ
jgi:hypothetical protein